MIWAPQLLYIFHNSPIWITHKWFSQIDTQFRDLIWGNKPARISLNSLQLPKDRGGTAVPHARYYFIASQIQHLSNWWGIDSADPIRSLLIPKDTSFSALSYLDAGLVHMSGSLPSIKLLNTLWKYIRTHFKIHGICSFTPLWRNIYFKELFKLEDFHAWEEAGIHYIAQLYTGSILKSFSETNSLSTIINSINISN